MFSIHSDFTKNKMNPQIQTPKVTKATRAPMRVLVTSGYEPSVGKTTLIRHLMLPLLDSLYANIKHVVFSDDHLIEKPDLAHETHYSKVLAHIFNTKKGECTIVEVSNSKFDDMMGRMEHGGSDISVSFNKIIVLVSYAGFRSKGTVAMFGSLIKTGIDMSRVHVVFNGIEEHEAELMRDTKFKEFIEWTRLMGINVVETPVMRSEIYAELKKRPGRQFEIGYLGYMTPDYFKNKLTEAYQLNDPALTEKATNEANIYTEARATAPVFKEIFNAIFMKRKERVYL